MKCTYAIAVGLSVMLAGSGWAVPWELRYDGTVFPEEEGWLRGTGSIGDNEPGAYRTIVDGDVLVLDSSVPGYEGGGDNYGWQIGAGFDPEPGEYFYARWRSTSDGEVTYYPMDSAPDDVGYFTATAFVTVFSSDGYGVSIEFGREGVFEGVNMTLTPDDLYAIEPGVMHEYELISHDMRTYALSVDGVGALCGTFRPHAARDSTVAFGLMGGPPALSQWDYVSFGVAPEPGSGVVCLAGLILGVRRRRPV